MRTVFVWMDGNAAAEHQDMELHEAVRFALRLAREADRAVEIGRRHVVIKVYPPRAARGNVTLLPVYVSQQRHVYDTPATVTPIGAHALARETAAR